MSAARAAAGLGVAACWARCTITADIETVDTTADATIASIMALMTCTDPAIRLCSWSLVQAPDAQPGAQASRCPAHLACIHAPLHTPHCVTKWLRNDPKVVAGCTSSAAGMHTACEALPAPCAAAAAVWMMAPSAASMTAETATQAALSAAVATYQRLCAARLLSLNLQR